MIKKFKNLHFNGLKRGLLDVLLYKIGYYKEDKPIGFFEEVELISECKLENAKPKVAWINHSSFLIQIEGISILTDPIWNKRCSPVSFLGPKRVNRPSIEMDKLPKIDFVFISHNHYDHLDKYSVKKLAKLFPGIIWIVPQGVKKWFLKNRLNNVYELNWWQNVKLKDLNITAVPSQHFSGRGIFDFNKTLWVGYVVECFNKKFYFAGDTGYNSFDFKEIGRKWRNIDLALIPIGCYLPKKFLKFVHVDPIEAVKIHREVNSSCSIAMHWNFFKLSDEPMLKPASDLKTALINEKDNSFIMLKPGLFVNW